MGTRLAKRVLVVGWDAADWKVIDPLLASGEMANLRRLIESGVRADLSSLDPKLSPLLWTSIATGKTADKHGILNFVEPEPEGAGLRPSCSTTRRTKALWNMLTQRGMRTNVVSWYASHPAEPIAGCVVSNLFQEGAPPRASDAWTTGPGAVHPAELSQAVLRKRVHPQHAKAEELRALLPSLARMRGGDPRVELLKKQLAQGSSVQAAAKWLLDSGGAWDLSMVFFETIDVVGHHFMQYYPPRMGHVGERDFEEFKGVMGGIYRWQDAQLGRLLASAPGATVIVLSDHGFHSDHLRPRRSTSVDDAHAAMDATWHRPHGMLVMSGPGVRRGAEVRGASLLDITPTVLTLLGLPVGSDMDGRVLAEALEGAGEIERVASWDGVEGEAGMHPADLRVDPFEARDAMRQLEELGYLAESGDGACAAAMCDRETRFNLGVVLMTTGRVGPAAEVFERLHAEHPGESRFSTNLANCWYAIGRHEEALRVLSELADRSPDSMESALLRGSVLLAQGKAEESAGVLRQAAAAGGGERADVLCALAEAYTRLERYGDAEAALGRAAAIDPHSAMVAHRRALLEVARGRFEDAVDHALTAVGLRHVFPEAHYTLGVALAWMGEHGHAVQSFRVALSMQPGMVAAHRFAVCVLEKMGDAKRAGEHRAAVEALEKGSAGRRGEAESHGAEAWMKRAE